MNFLNSNNLLYLRQYGFRKNMSTSMEIMELVENNIITNAMDNGKVTIGAMDNGKVTIGVFIDLKKAFDTVVILSSARMNIICIITYLKNWSMITQVINYKATGGYSLQFISKICYR